MMMAHELEMTKGDYVFYTIEMLPEENVLNPEVLSSPPQFAIYSVSQKYPPPLRVPDTFHFFHKRLRIFNRLLHTYYVPIYARLQIFIQLSQILTKLCHIKRDYPVHIICSKCPSSAETHAFNRLRSRG